MNSLFCCVSSLRWRTSIAVHSSGMPLLRRGVRCGAKPKPTMVASECRRSGFAERMHPTFLQAVQRNFTIRDFLPANFLHGPLQHVYMCTLPWVETNHTTYHSGSFCSSYSSTQVLSSVPCLGQILAAVLDRISPAHWNIQQSLSNRMHFTKCRPLHSGFGVL